MIVIPNLMFQLTTIIILLLYLFFIIKGIKDGFISTFLNLISTLAALLFAIIFCDNYSSYFDFVPETISNIEYLNNLLRKPLNVVVWAIVLFLGAKLVLYFLRSILNNLFKLPVLKQFNGLLGGLFGFIEGTIFIILLTAFVSLPLFKNGNDLVDSTVLHTISASSNKIVDLVFTEYIDDETIDDLINDISQKNNLVTENDTDTNSEDLEDVNYIDSNNIENIDIQKMLSNETIQKKIIDNNLQNYFTSSEIIEMINNNDISALIQTEGFKIILENIKVSELISDPELMGILSDFNKE